MILDTITETFMNLHKELDTLEEMILESGPRIMGRTLIDEEKICQQIDQVRFAIPDSVNKAQEILQYKQQIITEAEQYAADVVKAAELKAAKLVEDSAILRQVEAEAQEIRRHTQEDCEQMRSQTINEIDRVRRQAQKEWEAMRHKAVTESEDMQRGADEYSDRVLGNLENQLVEMIKIVQNGRKEIRR
jgi:cell division septum initiation protein DivIVA